MQYWSLQPIFSYPIILLLGLAALLLTLLRPSYGRATAARRLALIALRGVVIALIVLAMLRPTHVSTTKKRQTAVLVVLLDQSRSMLLPDSRAGKTRWLSQQEALLSAEPRLRQLAEELEIKIYAYDQQLRALDFAEGQIKLPQSPAGEQTDIGTCLFEAVQRELGQRLAGVILLGDGTQTAFAPKVEVREAGRELARLQYPLYTVAFGPTGDANQARDVALENLQDQYTVFVKNELQIRAAVRVGGYVNQALPVTLTIEDAKGNQQTLGPVSVTAREDGVQLPVEMTYIPQQAGRYKLTMRVAQQPGELISQNNHLTAFLNVLEGGMKVLYLYGDRLGEQSKLRESINASPDIELEHVFIDRKTRDQWPVDLGDILKQPKFDALLIEDVDSAALGDQNLAAIAAAVEQGKGLMMIGGFQSFGAGGYQSTVLRDVLPIEMDKFDRQEVGLDKPIRRDLHLWGKVPMLPTDRPHPVTRLAPAEENLEFWKQLPPLNGANRFDKDKVKPRSQLLAESPQGAPLLVAGEYGAGRVLAFAGNSTIRWWRFGRQTEHKRFWRQVILWLVRRDGLDQHDVWVKLEQRRFNPGRRVVFTAGARSPEGDVLPGSQFRAAVTGPDGKPVPVVISRDKEQIVGAANDVRAPGDYKIEVWASVSGKDVGKAQAEFVVFDQDLELSNAAADHQQLARLAKMTESAGGRVVAPEQLPTLLEELLLRPPEMEFDVQTKWQLGDTPTDAWLFFLLVVALLTGEWMLRKKWGLV